jgi:hypothetical protein
MKVFIDKILYPIGYKIANSQDGMTLGKHGPLGRHHDTIVALCRLDRDHLIQHVYRLGLKFFALLGSILINCAAIKSAFDGAKCRFEPLEDVYK